MKGARQCREGLNSINMHRRASVFDTVITTRQKSALLPTPSIRRTSATRMELYIVSGIKPVNEPTGMVCVLVNKFAAVGKNMILL